MRLLVLIAMFTLFASTDTYTVDEFTTNKGTECTIVSTEYGYRVLNKSTDVVLARFGKSMNIDCIKEIATKRY